MFPWQVFGLTGSDLLALTSQRGVASSVVVGVRTCLPLRGSSGFAPDSLFVFRRRKNHRNRPTISSGPAQAQRQTLWISLFVTN
jgi:hypothetical protein